MIGTLTTPRFSDWDNGNAAYYSLFDAMLDNGISAFTKISHPNIKIELGEIGWYVGGCLVFIN